MELHLETMFKAWTGYFGGSRELSYTCICGSGARGAESGESGEKGKVPAPPPQGC